MNMKGFLIKMLHSTFRLLTLLSVIDILQALQAFPKKFVVGEISKDVTLTCNTRSSSIVWKLENGPEPIKVDGYKQLHGKNLTLIKVDQPDAGNYTCWKGDELLDYHFLVIHDHENENVFSVNPDDSNNPMINCWSSSYKCTFNCLWETIHPAVFRAKIQRRSSSERDVWHYLAPNEMKKNTFQYTFSDPEYSPYEEEYEPILLLIEGVTNEAYGMISHQMFIRDIIKPDAPNVFKVKKTGQKTDVSWKYPTTWTRPFSYFPLSSEVECKQKEDNKIVTFKYEAGTEYSLSTDVEECRLRLRDSYYNSKWSNWTPWEKVCHKKKGHKNMKKKGTKQALHKKKGHKDMKKKGKEQIKCNKVKRI